MKRYYQKKEIILKYQNDGWGLLIDPKCKSSYAINELGVEIWKCLNNIPTIKEVIEYLNNIYLLGEISEVENDVKSFIQYFVKENLVLVHNTQNVMPFPVSLYVAITRECNLACSYCNYFSYSENIGNDRPVEEWIDFISKFQESGGKSICLSGGEPLLYQGISKILTFMVRKGLTFSILSNGSYIPKEILSIISSDNCIYVQLSSDGPNAVEHERNRKKSNFTTFIQNCKDLIIAGVTLSIRVTLNACNTQFIEEIADFYLNKIGVKTIHYSWCWPIGRGRNIEDKLRLDIDAKSRIYEIIFNLSKKYENRIIGSAGPMADLIQWRRMLDFTFGKISNLPYKGGFLSGCGCTNHMISARSDGKLVPCILMQDIILGDISDDLNKIWNQSKTLSRLRNREKQALSQFEKCSSCTYVNACTGDCPAIPYVSQGKLNIPNYTNCLKDYLHNGGIVPDTI